jgi:hypothetical protein
MFFLTAADDLSKVDHMDLNHSLESYFRDEVDRAFRDEGIAAGALTERYLVRLLAAYAAQPIADRPLALRLLETRDAPARERRACLREIGDTSLFLSGFWGESLSDKLCDVDYYIEMGGIAYGALAAGAEPAAAVFAELAAKFVRFVEVLMLVSRRTARARSDRDVVRLYDRWLRTKSRWAARRLAEAGVIPPVRGSGMVQ